MKKVLDQTVRDLKREVNKKVLKVPGIEQKVLDATSNEPWGPHGSYLADIAQATRNYNEYQMIMTVLWKRINDTGKNWRHVYKALTVLEYLVAHGSERVIDEIREHAYQISTLSDFQYIDSGGRDQGSNVRKKSQSLVVLVNDKERIQEARQKAVANRDKYRSAASTGGMYRPNYYSSTGGYGDWYDDDRCYRDDDRNGYSREREWGSRDNDRYGRGSNPYSRGGDRYGRDSDERYGRDGYRDDDNRSTRSNDDYQYRPRYRSADRERDRPYDDDDRYSSRSGGGRADDQSPEERRLERKFSEQNMSVPPSYEEAISQAQSHGQDERNGGSKTAAAPASRSSSPPGSTSQVPPTPVVDVASSPVNKEADVFDEFDPRANMPATPAFASTTEMDIFGLSEVVSPNELALIPVTSASTTPEADIPPNSGFGSTFVPLSSASTVLNQPSEDPFGDSPFKALPPEDNFGAQPHNFAPTTTFQPTTSESTAPGQPTCPKMETVSSFDFGDTFQGITYAPPDTQPPSTSPSFLPTGLPAAESSTDILAAILPPSGPTASVSSQTAFPAPTGQTMPVPSQASYPASTGPTMPPPSQASFSATTGPKMPLPSQASYSAPTGPTMPVPSQASFPAPAGPLMPLPSQASFPAPTGPTTSLVSHTSLPASSGPTASLASQTSLPALTGQPGKASPTKDKFETKSTVWADTLNRGLVNLNISGPKINPLADIGIDFESINRKEKRMEKPAAATVTSSNTMGKAMGSGSGIGRAGATGFPAPPNPMIGSSMGMAMGGGAGMGMGVGMGMGMGMGGMNQPMGMGQGMNMGMGQGVHMRPPAVLPPGEGMPGYNPMMGMGTYGSRQQYGSYR